jgi:DNA polymerase III alpha subunit (gram-positive type)
VTLVYLDTETTGLDPERHEIWELAYAVNDGPIYSGVVTHSLRYADPTALAMNGYQKRKKQVAYLTETECREALVGSTLVAANPAFDAAFLRARWGVAPWRYRLLDIEAYAMGALVYDVPRGLKDIAAELNLLGWEIPQPDHTASGDVRTLRECHRALKRIYGEQGAK